MDDNAITLMLTLESKNKRLKQRIAELEAKIERVEKLPDKWLEDENRQSYMVEKMGIACANELKEALK
jgi:DNA-dependent RNA polymerase auxiliary subunit epsilon